MQFLSSLFFHGWIACAVFSAEPLTGNCSSDISLFDPSKSISRSTIAELVPSATYFQLSNSTCLSNIPYAEYEALQALFESMNGQLWTPTTRTAWMFPTSANPSNYPNPCKENWEGISCFFNQSQHNNSCTIHEIALVDLNLDGFIPAAIASLQSLSALVLSSNFLKGSIPTELFSLSNLTILDLYENALTQSIPDQIGNLNALLYLDLAGNKLTSTIPSTIGLLSNLIELWLFQNRLTGPIPVQISFLKNLKDFNVEGNRLSGTIPFELGDLNLLIDLNLSNNKFVGTIPSHLSKLSSLIYLYVYGNDLQGTIPSSLGNVTSLQYLILHGNSLTGSLPHDLGNLVNLRFLYLYDNSLQGTIPASFAGLFSMQSLLLSYNSFSGTIGQVLSTMLCLSYFDISHNLFTGSVPSQIFLLPSIKSISMVQNSFHGSLPQEICQANSTLYALALDGLSAAKPSISILSSAYVTKYMQGEIPACVYQLPGIVNLTLGGNGFRGSLPPVVPSSSLKILDIGYNRLEGVIPLSFQMFPFQQLNASHNRFSGTCDQMGDFFKPYNCTKSAGVDQLCTPLLDLQVNRLSGAFPSSFHEARNIFILNGNMFNCKSSADLPQYDPGEPSSQCGSDLLEESMGAFFVCVAIAGMMILLWWHYLRSPTVAAVAPDKDLMVLPPFMPGASEIFWLTAECSSEVNKQAYKNVYIFLVRFMGEMRMLAVLLGLAVVAIYVPFILIVKLGVPSSNIMTFQYWWGASFGFMQGTQGAVGLFVAYVILIVFAVFLLQRAAERIAAPIPASGRPTLSSSPSTWNRLVSRGMAPDRFKAVKYYFFWFCVFLGLPLLDLAMMLFVDGFYLYLYYFLTNRVVSTVCGVILAIEKIYWNTTMVSSVLRDSFELVGGEKHATGRVMLQTMIVLMNNILVPNFANAIVNPNCLYTIAEGVFKESSTITVTLPYPLCVDVDGLTGTCLKSDVVFTTTTFQTPFLYSYQCSSSLLTAYIPIFITMYTYIALINPLVATALVRLCEWHSIYDDNGATKSTDSSTWKLTCKWCLAQVFMCIPYVYHTPRGLSKKHSRKTDSMIIFNIANFIANLLSNIVVMLSFGAAFPPLALLIVLAIVVETFQTQYLVGRMLKEWQDHSVTSNSPRLRSLEKEQSVDHEQSIDSEQSIEREQNIDKKQNVDSILSLRNHHDSSETDQDAPPPDFLFKLLNIEAEGSDKILRLRFFPTVAVAIVSAFNSFFLHDMIGDSTVNSEYFCFFWAFLPPVLIFCVARGLNRIRKIQEVQEKELEMMPTHDSDSTAVRIPEHDESIETCRGESCEFHPSVSNPMNSSFKTNST